MPGRDSAVSFWIVTIGAILLAMAVMVYLRSETRLLLDANLRGEQGPVEDGRPVTPGERLRLELRLARPAALVVLLEEPESRLEEIYPPPGDSPLLPGPEVRLPEKDAGWDTAEIRPGYYYVWILGAPRALTVDERAKLVGDFRSALGAGRKTRRSDFELRLADPEAEAIGLPLLLRFPIGAK